MTKGLKFGFIGLGQAGCNIANEFAKLGYKSIAINTSSTDLELLEDIHKNNKILINTGVQGAGKDPNVGKEALESHIEEVYKVVDSVFEDIDKLFVCAGMGGGTGSGMLPLMTEILIEQGFDVSVIATLPGGIESPRVQLVSLATYEELTQIEGLTNTFIIDNKKASERIPGIGIDTKYKMLNSSMANQLNNINEMSTKPSLMAFDAKDLETVLRARGIAILSQITIDNVDDLKNEITLSKLLKDAVETSLAPNLSNMESTAAVFLFELPVGKGRLITEKSIQIMNKEIGEPFDTFYGIYENGDEHEDEEIESKSNMGTLTVLLTGLDYNEINRVHEMYENIEKKEEKFSKMFEKQQSSSFKNKTSSLLDKFSTKKTIGTPTPLKKENSTLERLKAKKKNMQ